MTEPSTDLGDKMRALAETGHTRAAELREKATEFDAAVSGGEINPFRPIEAAKKMLGAWARARRLWCECTGELLI